MTSAICSIKFDDKKMEAQLIIPKRMQKDAINTLPGNEGAIVTSFATCLEHFKIIARQNNLEIEIKINDELVFSQYNH